MSGRIHNFNTLSTPNIELEYYMGIAAETQQFELESYTKPNSSGGIYHCRFRSKFADFDDIAKASRNGKVFQEDGFKAATIGHEIVRDTMASNRLEGEYDHPSPDSGKLRIGRVDRSNASHCIHNMDFNNKQGFMGVSTTGPGTMGPTLAFGIIENGVIPAFSIRIFSSARKIVDRAKGIRMSMAPYRFVTIDNVGDPSNKTATGAHAKNNDKIKAMMGRTINVDLEALDFKATEGIIEIAKAELFRGSSDVQFAEECLGLELESFDASGFAVFKDEDGGTAFMKIKQQHANNVRQSVMAGLNLI